MEFIFGAYDAKRKLVRMNKKTMENTPVRPSVRPSARPSVRPSARPCAHALIQSNNDSYSADLNSARVHI